MDHGSQASTSTMPRPGRRDRFRAPQDAAIRMPDTPSEHPTAPEPASEPMALRSEAVGLPQPMAAAGGWPEMAPAAPVAAWPSGWGAPPPVWSTPAESSIRHHGPGRPILLVGAAMLAVGIAGGAVLTEVFAKGDSMPNSNTVTTNVNTAALPVTAQGDAVAVAQRLGPAVATIVNVGTGTNRSLGSGFVISHGGGVSYLLTNNHVVDNADNFTVTAEDGTVLVFTQYVVMAKLLERHLGDRGIPTQLLHGGTPIPQRETMVQRFQDGEVPVFLLSLKAAGTGLNLTRADHVVHYDRWWNPAVEDQATDRAYRIGQTRPVQVHRLIAEGTVEEQIAIMLESKRHLADAVLGSGEAALTELSNEELAELLELRSHR